jgi:uncharacterized membrane protein
MINENYIYILILAFALSIIIVMASVIIPIRFYNWKRWKGLVLGLVLQPIVCAILIFCVFMGFVGYHESKTNRQRKSAMVAVCTVQEDSAETEKLTWYIKADDECFRVNDKKVKAYDVIRLDQASVGVDDRIVVKFDVKKKQVVATDFGKPIKVENVDWEQVKAYFGK